jgi:hypothetical protein
VLLGTVAESPPQPASVTPAPIKSSNQTCLAIAKSLYLYLEQYVTSVN